MDDKSIIPGMCTRIIGGILLLIASASASANGLPGAVAPNATPIPPSNMEELQEQAKVEALEARAQALEARVQALEAHEKRQEAILRLLRASSPAFVPTVTPWYK